MDKGTIKVTYVEADDIHTEELCRAFWEGTLSEWGEKQRKMAKSGARVIVLYAQDVDTGEAFASVEALVEARVPDDAQAEESVCAYLAQHMRPALSPGMLQGFSIRNGLGEMSIATAKVAFDRLNTVVEKLVYAQLQASLYSESTSIFDTPRSANAVEEAIRLFELKD